MRLHRRLREWGTRAAVGVAAGGLLALTTIIGAGAVSASGTLPSLVVPAEANGPSADTTYFSPRSVSTQRAPSTYLVDLLGPAQVSTVPTVLVVGAGGIEPLALESTDYQPAVARAPPCLGSNANPIP